MTTISLRSVRFGQTDTSRLVDCFRVFVCSTSGSSAVPVGDAFTTAAEAVIAADALFLARVAELSENAPEGAFRSNGAERSYVAAPDTAAEWGERIEVRARRAGSSDWTAI